MFEQAFKAIDQVLCNDAGVSSELDYTEQTSWILFLRYLDELESSKADQAELKGQSYDFILDEAHRWNAWAMPKTAGGKLDHNAIMTGEDLIQFVNADLFPL